MPGQVGNRRQRRVGFVPDRAARLKLRMLLQIAERGRRVQLDAAAVGLLAAGDDPHQRRLARAVGPDERNPLARANIKRHPRQHRLGAEVFDEVLDGEQDHAAILARLRLSQQGADR